MFGRRLFSLKNSIKRTRREKNSSTSHERGTHVLNGLVVVVLILVILLVSPLVTLFFRFDPNDSYGKFGGTRWDYRGKFKVLLIGVDKKEGGNQFVDGLVLLTVYPDGGEASLININPDILVSYGPANKQITFRRALLESENDIDLLRALSEELLATDIDRYVVVDKKFFEEIGRYGKNIDTPLSLGVVDQDLPDGMKWAKGDAKVSPCCVYEYLSADSNGRDDQLTRQLKLYTGYAKSIDNVKAVLGVNSFVEIVENNFYTDLSKTELFMIFRFLRTVPSESYNLVYTGSDILNKSGKAGVYDVFSVNYSLFDRQIDIILRDKDVQLEQATIEVQNASGKSGLAGKKARWISNIGAEIAHVANAPYPEKRTKVYIEDFEKYPNTVKQLKKIFGENADFIENEYQYRHIGQIVVVIGSEN